MKVFFTCSRTGSKLPKYRVLDLAVLQELKRLRLQVESTLERTYLTTNPSLKNVKDLAVDQKKYKYIHDTAVRQAIRRCDGLIIEASYPSFRLGFEAFFAISIQKPVLVVSKIRNYAALIDQPHFFGAQYTDFTLPDEIEKFIKHVRMYKLGIRFNMFLTEEQKLKIDEVSKRYNTSQSDYIRGLIDKDTNLS